MLSTKKEQSVCLVPKKNRIKLLTRMLADKSDNLPKTGKILT
jgi:hypothetical protein